MNKLGLAVAGASLLFAASSAVMADEPTRGFALEHGTIAEKGTVSADVTENLDSGSIRVGLGFGELVFNSNKVGTATGSDAIFKFGLPALDGLSELKHSWAVYGGVSYLDLDNDEDYFNLMAGVAFTGEIEQFSFTVAPELIVDDAIDETYLDLNLGAYFELAKTEYGTFKPGAELVVSSLSGKDTELYLGLKWGIKENVNLDIIPVALGNGDEKGLPGYLRLNIQF